MKKILFFLLVSLPFLCFAQVETSTDFTYEVGKPYKVVDAPLKQYFPLKQRSAASAAAGPLPVPDGFSAVPGLLKS